MTRGPDLSSASRPSQKDFRAELTGERCWDRATEAVYRQIAIPLDDCILQNREELIAFCEHLEREHVRRYLEIGTWTGRLLCTLDRLFAFDVVAAADLGAAEALGLPLRLPFGTRFFRGDSGSEAFRAFRAELGPLDLVLIDGDHGYDAVRRDFAINRAYPSRWLAFHDILGGDPTTEGVAIFWRELRGEKLEIVRPHVELGRPSTMGIGLWRNPG